VLAKGVDGGGGTREMTVRGSRSSGFVGRRLEQRRVAGG
jgi:hypothetical protein